LAAFADARQAPVGVPSGQTAPIDAAPPVQIPNPSADGAPSQVESSSGPADTTIPPATSNSAAPTQIGTPASGSEALPSVELALPGAGLDKDPLEGFNRLSFKFSQAVDKAVIRPAAMVYRHVIPKPLRDGAHNALSNLGEPLVFVNDLLQLRPDRAIRTLARFLINSTLGIGGLVDAAKRKPFYLPHHDNSLGDTLGYYGIEAGPYIYVPILGPTTLRDALGSAEDLVPPAVVGNPLNRNDYQVSTTVVDGLDRRERNDEDLKAMLSGAIDPYATFRANYLQNRAGEIAALKAKKGEAPLTPDFDEPLIDPAAIAPAPAVAPSAAGH
jgi:phospholipid-binding lipoprotein MlaA